MRHMNSLSEGMDIGTCQPRVGSRRGFTLVELLVVVAVIALLIGVLVPALAGARNAAVEMQEANNLRQIGIAYSAYINSTERYLNTWYPIGANGRRDRFRAILGLYDYVDGNREVFLSPSASRVGRSFSDPANVLSYQNAGSLHCAKLKTSIEDYLQTKDNTKISFAKDGVYDYKNDLVLEYIVNDSRLKDSSGREIPLNQLGRINASIKQPGIAGRRFNTVMHPDEVVLFTMTFDQESRFKKGNFTLMGDFRLAQFTPEQLNGSDKYGSVTSFYNWGHYYHSLSQN